MHYIKNRQIVTHDIPIKGHFFSSVATPHSGKIYLTKLHTVSNIVADRLWKKIQLI